MSNLDYAPVDKNECIIHPNKPLKFGHVMPGRTVGGKSQICAIVSRRSWKHV